MQLLAKFAFLLYLLIASAKGAWAADGRIMGLEGDVRVNGEPATSSTQLYSDDVITTAEGASVRIVLSDNSVLDLESDTQIRLSDYSYDSSASNPEQNKSDIDLVEGSLRYVSGLIAKDNPDNVSFQAGNATIGVRGSYTGIETDGATANVEAMIGEATFKKEGEEDTIIVPTGKTTQTKPDGEVTVVTSTSTDRVNEVVRAIAALAPDAYDSEREGCSRGKNPLRTSATPDVDPEAAAKIEKMLAELTEGELLMVIAVMNNNARHLCIDALTLASTLQIIDKVNPDVTDEALDLANQLDPDNSDQFNDAVDNSQDPGEPQDTDNSDGTGEDDTSGDPDIPSGGTGGTSIPSPE